MPEKKLTTSAISGFVTGLFFGITLLAGGVKILIDTPSRFSEREALRQSGVAVSGHYARNYTYLSSRKNGQWNFSLLYNGMHTAHIDYTVQGVNYRELVEFIYTDINSKEPTSNNAQILYLPTNPAISALADQISEAQNKSFLKRNIFIGLSYLLLSTLSLSLVIFGIKNLLRPRTK